MTHLFPALLADASSGGLLGALGIDWRALVLNAIAFLIILALLTKYVYPILLKALDAKADEMTAATRLQAEAEKVLAEAEKKRHAMLGEAQVMADSVMDAAKAEATETIAGARAKAEAEAARIVAEASEQLTKDITAARSALRAETAMLVATATEALTGQKLTSVTDQDLIKHSLEDK